MICEKIYDDVRRDRDRWKARCKTLERRIHDAELEASRQRRKRIEESSRAPSRLEQLFSKANIGDDAVTVDPAHHRVSA